MSPVLVLQALLKRSNCFVETFSDKKFAPLLFCVYVSCPIKRGVVSVNLITTDFNPLKKSNK
jgi:hypothetical protein